MDVRSSLLALLLPVAPLPAMAEESLATRLAALGAVPCEDIALTCLTLPMPHDHGGAQDGPPVPVTFAIHPAREESAGILVFSIGGPGYAALPWAETYLASFDPELVDSMDIVFFDQRGTGEVHGISCPGAELAFALAPLDPVTDPAGANRVAETFVQDCLTEADTDLLDVVGTDQAAHDLELFRQAIGAPPLWVYGESYGTQFAQTYATLHPQGVAGIIIDGVVDLTLTFEEFYADFVAGSDRIVSRVFSTCAATPDCAADFDGDPAAAFDLLAARLRQAPITATLGDSSLSLTSRMLENSAFYALYSPEGRTAFLRSLAAAHRGNPLHYIRLALADLGVDIASGLPDPDPSWYAGAYFAITCLDYAAPGATAAERAATIIAEAQARIAHGTRFPNAYFAERLICAYWPSQGQLDRPAPYAGGDWPTLVLTSDADPITPASMALSVADGAQNASTVVMEGGPHVILARGLSCPDRIVTDLVLHGIAPAAGTQICRQDLLSPYPALTLTGDVTPLSLARAIDTELTHNPTIGVWDGGDTLTTGCDYGGTLALASTPHGTAFFFDHCALWPDLVLHGKGLQAETGEPGDGFTFDLQVSGRHTGRLSYASDTMTGAERLSGTWDGAEAAPLHP